MIDKEAPGGVPGTEGEESSADPGAGDVPGSGAEAGDAALCDDGSAVLLPVKVPDQVPEVPSVPDDKVRDRLVELAQLIERSYFEMGRHLFRVYHLGLFRKWGFATFEDYVTNDLEFQLRKAQYLVGIWKNLRVKCGVQDDDIRGVPWSKAKEISTVATPDNVYDWVEHARTTPAHQLQVDVREAKKNGGAPPSKQSQPGDARVSDVPQDKPAEKPVEVEGVKRFAVTMYDGQYEILKRALALAEKRAQSDKTCHVLALIAQEFCTYNTPEDPDRAVEWFAKMMERTYGVKFIIAKTEALHRSALELLAADAVSDGELHAKALEILARRGKN